MTGQEKKAETMNADKQKMRMDEEQKKLRIVNQPVPKVDAGALVTGKPVYTNDIAPEDCLIVKVLRSPHAHARITEIKKDKALLVPGVECILTYEDAPQARFTIAGQTYPEPSPYDRRILEDRVRFVGDAVALVAARSEEAAVKALKLIKVKYEVLPAVLDFRTAKDNEVLVHPEEDWKSLAPVGADNKRNLCAHEVTGQGDVDEVLAACPHVLDRVYHTKANQQAMMETFRTYTYLDPYGRLCLVSSTQVPFHVRRIIANALDIPKHRVKVVKPRIGGGFGAKQSAVSEMYPALVTWKTGKPAKIVYSRRESFIASSPRHEMEIRVRLGADENGIIQALDVYTLSNTGAYGEHGPTTVGLSGHKPIPLYGKAKAYRFGFDVVYTNTLAAGAYRGYGATQGVFAVESAVNELAGMLGMDPTVIREKNMVQTGQIMPAYYGEKLQSCTLDRCMARAKEMMDWDAKYPFRDMGNGKVRGVGVSMCMQGSGISGVDTATVEIKVNDDGFYSLLTGATDMGTGCDTILAQMAAESLDCPMDEIVVYGVDTDSSPYDTGSYASSTTYVTGMATVKACEKLIGVLCERGADIIGCDPTDVYFDGEAVICAKTGEKVTRAKIGNAAMCAGSKPLSAAASFSSPVSPPPFMVGMAEVEIDRLTGGIDLIDYVAVVDCGTVINPALARVQAEGGLAQGIGMAMFEDVIHSKSGKNYSNSFMQYRIPSRLDVGTIRVDFESSYEPTGPFGAKSIGEIVINTPPAAISNAVQNAVGVTVRELPITPEKIFWGMQGKKSKNK